MMFFKRTGMLVVATLIAATVACVAHPGPPAEQPDAIEVDWPARRLWVGAAGVEGIKIRAVDANGAVVTAAQGILQIDGLTTTSSAVLVDGATTLPPTTVDAETVNITWEQTVSQVDVPVLAGPLSLLPAIFAILLALTTRQVLLSLFGGVVLGTTLIHRELGLGSVRALDVVVQSAADSDHVKIIVFTMLMGGVVGLITANGGTAGVVEAIARRARTVRSGSIATWALGMLIFFDDYASSLIIGTTMRPITDRLKISREKLSYMVDSTAAPDREPRPDLHVDRLRSLRSRRRAQVVGHRTRCIRSVLERPDVAVLSDLRARVRIHRGVARARLRADARR